MALEGAARAGDPALLWVPVHPAFAELRGEARYRAALSSLSPGARAS